MRKTSIWISAALIIVCLTGGIQKRSFIGSLKTSDGYIIAEKDGNLVLDRGQDGIAPKADAKLKVWQIGAPYLSCQEKFLSIDQFEEGVKVSLTSEKTDSAKWVIEVLNFKSPKTRPKEHTDLVEGNSERTFRLGIFEGRYKGWYLAAKEVRSSTDVPTVVEFRVVKDPKQALSFCYVDSSYSITHK